MTQKEEIFTISCVNCNENYQRYIDNYTIFCSEKCEKENPNCPNCGKVEITHLMPNNERVCGSCAKCCKCDMKILENKNWQWTGSLWKLYLI